jgi:nitrous oxidase accessory protein NosD
LNNSGPCITVVDTSKYFVVRNVHLVGGKIAIRFEGVYNGRVTESVIENCSIGVSASFSEVSRVDNNLIANCSIGVSLR